MIDLSTPSAVASVVAGLTMSPLGSALASVFGLQPDEFGHGWSFGILMPEGGDVVVLYHEHDQVANVRYHDPKGNFLRVESHDLSQSSTQYFHPRFALGHFVGVQRVSENVLDDTTPAAVVEGDKANSARLDQFYHARGFFQVSCSEELPADLLAHAVLAAWRAIERDAGKIIEPFGQN